MTNETRESLKKSLLNKGYSEHQAEEIISMIPIPAQIINPQPDPLESLITKLLDNPSIKELITHAITAKEKEDAIELERETKFHTFLSKLDIRQKWYNALFVLAASGIILGLTRSKVIGAETAQTVFVLIIGLSMQNGISSFFKSSKSSFNED